MFKIFYLAEIAPHSQVTSSKSAHLSVQSRMKGPPEFEIVSRLRRLAYSNHIQSLTERT